MSSSAVQTVINIPELLQLILLQCDMRTLLTGARGVSLLWRDIIDSTPAIQKALFFRPDTRNDGSEAILNPLLTETFSTFFDGSVHDEESFEELPIGGKGPLVDALSLLFDGIVKESSRRDAFRRKDASWRRMLVRQPPVGNMPVWEWDWDSVILRIGGVIWPGVPRRHFQPCEGCPLIDKAIPSRTNLDLTMGMLYDEVVDNVISDARFCLKWNPKKQANLMFAGLHEDQIHYFKDPNLPISDF
ncbi:hypothetical protein F4860DRAFT_516486 [Xylaria cubensis]|nr:hypothetical protein F4860DRAFT_516486 [Xylaria cubensis]